MTRILLVGTIALLASCNAVRPARMDAETEQLAVEAAAGNDTAQYNLAVAYYTGRGVAQDYGKAAVLWRPLAERGNPEALNNVGYLTYYGMGVPEDASAGVALWRKAVSLGSAESSFHLGHAALDGKGMTLDSVDAFARFRAAILMPGATPDEGDREIAGDAAEKLRELCPRLSDAQRERGEAMARSYAARSPRMGVGGAP